MDYNPYTLVGKTILITGAASGIGRATALVCAKMGAKLYLTDINNEGLLQTNDFILKEIPGNNLEHNIIVSDLTKETEIENLVSSIDSLDGMACNAGVMKLTLAQFITSEEIERIQKINLIAPMLLTKWLLKKKKFKKPASIVFTASAAGIFRVSVGNAIYATTKCGIDAYMRTIALEQGPKGIRCNSVNPGIVETNLINNGQFNQEQLQKELQNYPLGRFGKPEDIALAIVYLLSDASSFVTGTALKIDGGMTLS